MRHEDDLRATLRTLEHFAPDTDAVVRAARAQVPGRRRLRPIMGAHRLARAGRTSRIAPLGAAVGVAAVVAGSAFIANTIAPDTTPPVPTSAPPIPGAASPTFTPDGLPAYFLEYPVSYQAYGGGAQPGTQNDGSPPIARRFRSHETLRVVATATGKVAATATLPGYVTAIAASNGAFFAAVVTDNAARFYAISLDSSGTRTRVSELPIQPDTATIEFLAASPDGSKLAYSTLVMHGSSGDVQNLVVASTTHGSQRQWTTPPQDSQGSMGLMNWLGDGRTLAFSWTGTSQTSLRLLDTAASGGDLMASKALLPLDSAGSFDQYTVSPDGKIVVSVVSARGSPSGRVGGHQVTVGSVVQFSAATRRPAVLYQPPMIPGYAQGQQTGCNDLPLWISSSGRKVLLDCLQQRPAAGVKPPATVATVVLIDDGHVRQLPWLAATATEVTAFAGITAIGGTYN
jgi:hypothetical protein